MSEAEIDALRSLYAEWARGSFSRTDLFDPEIEFTYSADFPDPGTFTGIPALQEGWRRWLGEWEDVAVAAEDFLQAEDGSIVALVLLTGRGRASGAPMSGEGANVWRFRRGRAVSLTLYASRANARRDAGISP